MAGFHFPDDSEPEVVAAQVRNGAAIEPGAVKLPGAAKRRQALGDEGFEGFEPGHAFLKVGDADVHHRWQEEKAWLERS